MDETIERVRNNIFYGAHGAIHDWEGFPWHTAMASNKSDSWKKESSQALSIDVFGTIKASPDRDAIVSALAHKLDIEDAGPWTVKLEWKDPENLLNEQRRTQVDAIAWSDKSVLVFECKFTEVGGSCSQPNILSSGANKGLRQCNGNYELQTNPVEKSSARCALTGKQITYWQTIPRLFGLDANADYSPCPFRGDAYQWMRNVVLADRVAKGRAWKVVAAFAEGEGFPTSDKVKKGVLGHRPSNQSNLVVPMSYQDIAKTARLASSHPSQWTELEDWIANKVSYAQRLRSRLKP